MLDFALDSLVLIILTFPVAVISDPLAVADRHVELGNLVSVLAGGWNFDRTLPVKITVTERVGELLDVDLLQRALVEGHKAVRRKYTALVGGGRRDEEVERLEAFILRASMLDQPSVDDASAGGILEPTLLVPQEESLVNALVDDDERNFRPS